MPASREATPVCDNLPRTLFTYPEQLRIPLNRIEPAATYNQLFARKRVLGYVICETTAAYGEHVHIVARHERPKLLSQTELDAPARSNKPPKLHCLTLLWPESAEKLLCTLDELTVEQLTKIVETQ